LKDKELDLPFVGDISWQVKVTSLTQ